MTINNLQRTAASVMTLLLMTEGMYGASAYTRHNLVSDVPGVADRVDAKLTNPWGIAASSTSPFWISDNHSGMATLYNTDGVASALQVTIAPPPGSKDPAAPTGQVFNGGAGFELVAGKPAVFILSTEDGTISGWSPSVDMTHTLIRVNKSSTGAVYKGLAIATSSSGPRLYAPNFHSGEVDVFDSNFNPVNAANAFIDPSVPAGFAPFNIQLLAGKLYVTYAKQDDAKHDDVQGKGNGYVSVFDPDGNLIQHLASGGALNSPWGVALAPAAFGDFSNQLLVGNFGDGVINVYDVNSGVWIGSLQDKTGNPIAIPGLWALQFGNGGNGGNANTLYFTAGIAGGGKLEDHGLLGSIQAVSTVPGCPANQ